MTAIFNEEGAMPARIIDLTLFMHRNAFRRPPLIDARVIELNQRRMASVAGIFAAQATFSIPARIFGAQVGAAVAGMKALADFWGCGRAR